MRRKSKAEFQKSREVRLKTKGFLLFDLSFLSIAVSSLRSICIHLSVRERRFPPEINLARLINFGVTERKK